MTPAGRSSSASLFATPVLVDTVIYRVVRLKDARRLGTFKLGEIKKVA